MEPIQIKCQQIETQDSKSTSKERDMIANHMQHTHWRGYCMFLQEKDYSCKRTSAFVKAIQSENGIMGMIDLSLFSYYGSDSSWITLFNSCSAISVKLNLQGENEASVPG